jgi:hypothetical protein
LSSHTLPLLPFPSHHLYILLGVIDFNSNFNWHTREGYNREAKQLKEDMKGVCCMQLLLWPLSVLSHYQNCRTAVSCSVCFTLSRYYNTTCIGDSCETQNYTSVYQQVILSDRGAEECNPLKFCEHTTDWFKCVRECSFQTWERQFQPLCNFYIWLAQRPNKPIPQCRALCVTWLVNKLHTLLEPLKEAKGQKWRDTSVQRRICGVWGHHSNEYSDCSLLYYDADMYTCFQGTCCLHHQAKIV